MSSFLRFHLGFLSGTRITESIGIDLESLTGKLVNDKYPLVPIFVIDRSYGHDKEFNPVTAFQLCLKIPYQWALNRHPGKSQSPDLSKVERPLFLCRK